VASTADDVRAYGAMLAGGDELRRFAQRTLQPLLDYDRAHGSALVPTLAAYLDCAASPTATARQLNLHINSLYYRLQRLMELGGFSLDDPDVRFELQLALRVLQTTTGLLE
jgi:DNA-binding PucR family transcriptional regulator